VRLDVATPWYLGATPLATLPWLIRLRWTSAFIETALLAFAVMFPNADFPLRRIFVILAVAAICNVAMAVWLSRARPLPRPLGIIGITIEVLLLTGLLELTGGPFNPFAVILGIQVTLAALTLGSIPALGIGTFATLCYGVLVYWHTRELVPGHHRLNDFPTHLFTMWVAVAVTAELAAYFVVQASTALAKRGEELEVMRLKADRAERLASLTTLAAGAAHELSTPLATIALAARELERAARPQGSLQSFEDDARLIRNEVDRCRAILDQMSGRAGGVSEDIPEPIDLSELVNDVRGRLPSAEAGRIRIQLPQTARPVLLPVSGLRQTLLSLIKNAIDASEGDILVKITEDEEKLRLTVHDSGHGMAPDVLRRAGDPFFTTKEPGRGLGLGLFLARVFAERCGGSLTLQSQDGTIASLELPRQSAFARMT
jgi:two-component system sensor histidine kinase RegB